MRKSTGIVTVTVVYNFENQGGNSLGLLGNYNGVLKIGKTYTVVYQSYTCDLGSLTCCDTEKDQKPEIISVSEK
ncbi:MAG: hypothetical protein LBE91_00310 [Tannerella sp.]|jgi:hypothetical protein|nr:hypothetical protein [Tannerella sp.]